jgi:8-oxo-dGTP pyrophosphatase MutT (NUDIX family)
MPERSRWGRSPANSQGRRRGLTARSARRERARVSRPRGKDARAAGVVVVRRAADGWRCLVLRAYRNWDFPKGLVEPGEVPEATAAREVREETSLEALAFRWGYDFRETQPYAGGKVARFYVAESATGEVILPVSETLGRPEHHEWRWARFDEAAALLPPRLAPILAWARAAVEGAGEA